MDLGMIEVDAAGPETTQMDSLKNMLKSDVALNYGRPSDFVTQQALAILNMAPAGGKYPPTLIWTLDDNYHFVDPLNWAFVCHGTRMPNGTLLTPGCTVVVDVEGVQRTLWEDGVVYGTSEFDVGVNQRNINKMDVLLEACGGVALTTKRLEDYYRGVGYTKTYVYPNSVYFPHYDTFKDYVIKRRDPEMVKVMWQGGASHYPDWWEMRDTIVEAARRHPKVKFIIWGTSFKSIHGRIPEAQVELIEWMDYKSYKYVLGSLDFDFCIAPLAVSKFNDGKSSIKMYEAACLPEPKPTLASRTAPYIDDIIDGQTGMLYSGREEFLEKFGTMVEDAALRKTLGQNANTWLHENVDALKTTPPFIEWMLDQRATMKGRLDVGEMVREKFEDIDERVEPMKLIVPKQKLVAVGG